MEELLIPLFVFVVFFGLLLVIALVLYSIPVRFSIAYLHEPGRNESAVQTSFGPLAILFSKAHGFRITRILLWGREIRSRTEPLPTPIKSGDHTVPGSVEQLKVPAEIVGLILPLLREAADFFDVVWHESRLDGMTGNVRIGIRNPASLGMICGGYWASRPLLEENRITVAVEPVFFSELLDINVVIRLQVRHPLPVIIRGIVIARNPAMRRLMHFIRQPAGAVNHIAGERPGNGQKKQKRRKGLFPVTRQPR